MCIRDSYSPEAALALRDTSTMDMTPQAVIDAVVRSVCGEGVDQLDPLSGGGRNEAYRCELSNGTAVVVRIARQSVPWFADEAALMAQARDVGVPSPQVIGVEHQERDGELLSFSILEVVQGRSLEELVAELSTADVDRLIVDAGELLARLHSIGPSAGAGHRLAAPDDQLVARVVDVAGETLGPCLLYTSPSPRDATLSRMPSSA